MIAGVKHHKLRNIITILSNININTVEIRVKESLNTESACYNFHNSHDPIRGVTPAVIFFHFNTLL